MDETSYLLSSPANRERLMASMAAVRAAYGSPSRTFYQVPATVDDSHRVLYDGEGDWLLETDSHVGEDVA